MKRATENLINDHVLIMEAMDVMEQITATENPRTEHLDLIVSFIREFADGCHHAKEEGLLFPKLVQKGMPSKQGPIGVMLMEHDNGRTFVRSMAENIILYKSGNQEALKLIYSDLQSYINLLRDHISKENNILFRMADNFLTPEEQDQLLAQFSQTESTSEGFNKKLQLFDRIKEITAVYEQKEN
jgi:hemerythrin-like domain-containing protein